VPARAVAVAPAAAGASVPAGPSPRSGAGPAGAPSRDARRRGVEPAAGSSGVAPASTPLSGSVVETAAPARHVAWTFGALPELMELKQGGQALIGFPALVDKATHVEIEVFDEPEVAARRHRAGLRRLLALQLREALKYLTKNLPDQRAMEVAYLPLGSPAELQQQVIDLALDRAFLAEPLPNDAAAFARRLEEGRGRLTLIANEIARSAAAALEDHGAALRKLKDARPPKDVADDVNAQLARLMPKRFLAETPWPQVAHLPRYLKAIVLRLEKQRGDPQRDAQRLAELRPLEQRYLRFRAERKGAADARLEDFRWLLEELRVSLFAQELRTPQPVSAKRLEKAWAQVAA
jgi:ATP-dependent helicase HrpA